MPRVFSLGLWAILSNAALAQEPSKPAPPAQVKQDTIARLALRKGVRVGTDVVPWGITALDARFIYGEGSLELLIGRPWWLVAEAGFLAVDRPTADYQYRSTGAYLRLGIDWGLIPTDPKNTGAMASVGFRYGFSPFQQSLDYQLGNSYWGVLRGSVPPQTATAHWIEGVGTFRLSFFKQRLLIGPALRIKVRLNSPNFGGFEAHDIPGFGFGNRLQLQAGYQLWLQLAK